MSEKTANITTEGGYRPGVLIILAIYVEWIDISQLFKWLLLNVFDDAP